MKKITIWRNPTPLDPRWDAEIVHDDGTHERIININKKEAQGLIGEAMTNFKNPKGDD